MGTSGEWPWLRTDRGRQEAIRILAAVWLTSMAMFCGGAAASAAASSPTASAPAALPAAELERAWAELAADKPQAALARLAEGAQPAINFLRERLSDQRRLRELIALLDNDAWRVRQQATEDLIRMAARHRDFLRKALAEATSAEVKVRLEMVLAADAVGALLSPSQSLQARRACQVLAKLGPPGQAALRQLVQEAAWAQDFARQALHELALAAVEPLAAQARQALRAGQFVEAGKALQQALAAGADSPAAMQDLTAWRAQLSGAVAEAGKLEAALRADPPPSAARPRLLRVYLVELDCPPLALKHLAEPAGEIDQSVKLAVAKELTAAQRLKLAQWYEAQALNSPAPVRGTMLRRAREHYQAFVAAAPGPAELAAVRQALMRVEQFLESRSDLLDLGGGATLALVHVPPGEFTMGSPANEPLRAPWEQQHKVTITRGFYMGRFEVTVGQFAAFVRDTGYKTAAEQAGRAFIIQNWQPATPLAGACWRAPGNYEPTDEHAVTCINLQDAMEFCAWASRKTGRVVRLATDAEWEYACRAGTTTACPWGADPKGGDGWCNLADATVREKFPHVTGACGWNDGYLYTSPVGKFKPNAWGLHDMLGNAWEWVLDRHAPFAADAAVDPCVPLRPGDHGVLRGRAWDCDSARSAERGMGVPENPDGNTGFRVVAEATSGRRTDLLAAVNVEQDEVTPAWKKEKETWCAPGRRPGMDGQGREALSLLRLCAAPAGEYDVSVEFTRTAGSDGLSVILERGGRDFLWCVGHTRADNTFGLHTVNGQWVGDPANPTRAVGPPLEQRRHSTLVQVRRQYIAGYYDGKLMMRHTTQGDDLGNWEDWKIGGKALGLGCYNTAATFHKIELIEYDGPLLARPAGG